MNIFKKLFGKKPNPPTKHKSPMDVCGEIVDGKLFLTTTDEETLREISEMKEEKLV